MKGKTVFTGILFILLILICDVAKAQERYVVTAARLNVRKAAGPEAAVVGSLSKGDQIDVYGFKGSWAEIGFKNGHAYVAKKFLEPIKVVVLENKPIEQEVVKTETPIKETYIEPETGLEIQQIEGIEFMGFISLFASFTKNSTYLFNTDDVGMVFTKTKGFLPFVPKSMVLATVGVGISYHSYKSYSDKNINKTSVYLPIHAGCIIGDLDGFNGTIQAGFMPSFIVTVPPDNMSRFGLAGSLKGTIGFKDLRFLTEFMFPFGDEDPTLFFGICFSLRKWSKHTETSNK